MDASRVYVGAWELGCFYSLISTQTFRRALTASVDSCAEIKIECPFSGGTKSGRVWRKVPESDASSVKRGELKAESNRGPSAYQPIASQLSPFLTGRMFVRRTYFGHFDEV